MDGLFGNSSSGSESITSLSSLKQINDVSIQMFVSILSRYQYFSMKNYKRSDYLKYLPVVG